MLVSIRKAILAASGMFLIAATMAVGSKKFPALERIISSEYTKGMSSLDLRSLESEAKFSANNNPRNEQIFILCIDTRSVDLTNYISALEDSISTTVSVLLIDSKVQKVACFQTSSTFENLSTYAGKDIMIQRFPDHLKIHESVVELAEANLELKRQPRSDDSMLEDLIPDYLIVHFSRAQSLINHANLNNEEREQELMVINERTLRDALEKPAPSFRARGRWAALKTRVEKCGTMPVITAADLIARKASFMISTEKFHGLPVDCFASFIESLVEQPRVVKVAIENSPILFNFEARGITQSSAPFVEPFTSAGLTGLGQVVGVADSGLNDLSCFFYDQATGSPTPRQLVNSATNPRTLTVHSSRRSCIQYNFNQQTDGVDDQAGHGTHVVGSILGSCLENATRANGMAAQAKVSFFDIGRSGRPGLSVTPSLTAILNTAYFSGARVHSNSWGSTSTAYDSRSEELDRYQYDNPDFLTLFAAGNSGRSGQNTVGSPAGAKNCLTVGAMTKRVDPFDQIISQRTVASFSSIGPTPDGRFAIDVVAPGDYVVSAYAGNPNTLQAAINAGSGTMQRRSVLTMSGTSMATPVVAGNALLVRQYFMNESFWASLCIPTDEFCKSFAPSAALLKALLIQSGIPVHRYSIPSDTTTAIPSRFLGPPPDIFQGFGMVTLNNILPLKDGAGLPKVISLFVYDSLVFESNFTYQFNLTISEELAVKVLPLKATIVWIDVPYPSSQTGRKVLMNDVDLAIATPRKELFWGNKVDGGDDLNTVEQVYLNASEVGTYIVYIKANNLVANQAVSLVISYPTGPVVIGPLSNGKIPVHFETPSPAPSAAPAPAPAPAPLPLSGQDFSHPRYAYAINHLVTCSAPTPLPSFRAVGDLMLASLAIQNQPSNNVFSLSVIITAPNGFVAQIGSNGGSATRVYSDSNLYFRTWQSGVINSTRGNIYLIHFVIIFT